MARAGVLHLMKRVANYLESSDSSISPLKNAYGRYRDAWNAFNRCSCAEVEGDSLLLKTPQYTGDEFTLQIKEDWEKYHGYLYYKKSILLCKAESLHIGWLQRLKKIIDADIYTPIEGVKLIPTGVKYFLYAYHIYHLDPVWFKTPSIEVNFTTKEITLIFDGVCRYRPETPDNHLLMAFCLGLPMWLRIKEPGKSYGPAVIELLTREAYNVLQEGHSDTGSVEPHKELIFRWIPPV